MAVQGRIGWSFLSKQLLAADEWQRDKRSGCYSSTGHVAPKYPQIDKTKPTIAESRIGAHICQFLQNTTIAFWVLLNHPKALGVRFFELCPSKV